MKPSSILLRASLSLFALISTLPLRAASSPASLEERLDRLEKQLARIEARLADTVSADELAPTLKEYSELTRALGWDGKSSLNAVKPAGKEQKLALGGFFHINAETGNAPDARFTGIADRVLIRRARLGVTATFAEAFGARLEGDFGNNAVAGNAGYRAQACDAYVQWTKYPEFTLRGGQFKTPFGYEQLASDTKTFTIERSLPNDRLTFSRQIGLMAQGDVLNKRVNYSVGAFNGNGVNNGANDNENFMTVGRLAVVGYDGKTSGGQKVRWTAGANGMTTYDNGTFTGRKYGWGVDTQLVLGAAEFWAEWLRNDMNPATGASTSGLGWSALAAYTFAPKWQGVVRYESYDSNTSTAATTTREWVFGLNFMIKGDDLKLSLNYLVGKQPSPASSNGRVLGRMQVMF